MDSSSSLLNMTLFPLLVKPDDSAKLRINYLPNNNLPGIGQSDADMVSGPLQGAFEWMVILP